MNERVIFDELSVRMDADMAYMANCALTGKIPFIGIIIHSEDGDESLYIQQIMDGLPDGTSPSAYLSSVIAMAYSSDLTTGATVVLCAVNEKHPRGHVHIGEQMTTSEYMLSDIKNGWVDAVLLKVNRRGVLCKVAGFDKHMEVKMEYSNVFRTRGEMMDAVSNIIKTAMQENFLRISEMEAEADDIKKNLMSRLMLSGGGDNL